MELLEFDNAEVESETRLQIEANLPALNSALKEKYKSLTQDILNETGADTLDWDSGDASEPGITLTDGFNFSGITVDRVGEESLKYLFNYVCKCEVDFSLDRLS